MKTDELKFLLKLLGCPDYRSSLTARGFKDFKGKDRICRDLCDRGIVDFTREIATIKMLPPGSALLDIDKEQLPLTANELKVLEKIGKVSGNITPSKIRVKSIKSAERDAILQSFDERGFIEVILKIKRQKAEVWITQEGLEYLRDEFIPKKGTNPVISLDLLTNYLRFLRKSPPPPPPPTEEEILQLIRDLDKDLGTDNYLPIFHLREKLKSRLSREKLDEALYSLQKQDKIDLSSLVEAIHYTSKEIDAGIPQDVGGPLFFLIVN
ncbi:MAG: transcription factor RcaD [Xenococcaceae cyanobacterium]